jgi:hypothetical protein
MRRKELSKPKKIKLTKEQKWFLELSEEMNVVIKKCIKGKIEIVTSNWEKIPTPTRPSPELMAVRAAERAVCVYLSYLEKMKDLEDEEDESMEDREEGSYVGDDEDDPQYN